MGLTVYDTADLPTEDRFEWWREVVSQGAGATDVTSEDRAASPGAWRCCRWGLRGSPPCPTRACARSAPPA
ncbi:hypothetical protein GCM10020254_79120 [Streptomyces goshikiensis]